jgi:adenine-specific DNA-methyltransferase
LYFKGKRKGQTLELYANPLSSIPIKNSYNSNILENFHEQIIELKSKKQETSHLEQQIDNLVYKLYELTYDEVLVVEPAFSERMSREAYEGLQVG